MSKQEFLKGLEAALLEQMDISEAAPHIRYYQDYIENEIKNGKTEEEVMSCLQNPRLIAKTILDNGNSAKKYNNNVYDKEVSGQPTDSSYKNFSFSINGKPINSLLAKIIIGIILALFLVVVLVIVSGVLWVISRIVLPVVVIVGVIYMVIKLTRSGKI